MANKPLVQLGNILESVSKNALEAHLIGEPLARVATRQQQYLKEFGEIFQTLAASSEEISATCSSVTERTRTAADETSRADREVANLGEMTKSLSESKNQLSDLQKTMTEVGQKVLLISDIANKVNLLALNASIEAARAGDAGRGFAVVADEVKKLSNSTSKAAETIRKSIENAQTSVETVTQKLSTEIDAASTIASETAKSVGSVNTQISSIAGAVKEIAVATHNQSASLNTSLNTLNSFIATSGRTKDIIVEMNKVKDEMTEESKSGIAAFRALDRLSRSSAEVQESKASFALLERVFIKVNQTNDLHKIFEDMVGAVCENMGWDIAHVLMPDEKGVTHSSKIWHLDSRYRGSTFVQMSEAGSFEPGKGLPGRVYQNKTLEWIPDVTADTNFPRAAAAKALGIVSGMAFPIITRKHQVIAVIEYFAHKKLQPSQSMVTTLQHIGQITGQVTMSNEILQELDK